MVDGSGKIPFESRCRYHELDGTDRRDDSETTFFRHSCYEYFLLPHFDTNYRNPTAIGATQSKINTPEPSPIQHTQSISFVIRIHHDDE